MYSVCVDRDQPRLDQLELLSLFLIVSVHFQTVSALQSVEVQHKILFNLNLIFSDMGVDYNILLLVFLTVGLLKIH